MVTAFVSLGSNLNHPEIQLDHAISAIKDFPETFFISISSKNYTQFVGAENQPDVLNAVLQIKTGLPAEVLMEKLLEQEKQQGRLRSETSRYVGRTIDLDLLLYDHLILNTKQLTLPHPKLYEREFVLTPLAEIASGFVLPNGQTVQQCLALLLSQ